jgi:endonuclease-3
MTSQVPSPRGTEEAEKARRAAVVRTLLDAYPEARCELEHEDAFQLLVATILSAQSPDRRVNLVTRRLFQTVRGPEDLLALGEEGLAERIRDLGLYRSKARHLVATAAALVERHGGVVPADREALERLPGVGRKTASVVLATAFGIPALPVDTHVFRVSHRLGLATSPTPAGTERELAAALDPDLWIRFHHTLIFHGRRICHARRPQCGRCPVVDLCPAAGAGAPLPLGAEARP